MRTSLHIVGGVQRTDEQTPVSVQPQIRHNTLPRNYVCLLGRSSFPWASFFLRAGLCPLLTFEVPRAAFSSHERVCACGCVLVCGCVALGRGASTRRQSVQPPRAHGPARFYERAHVFRQRHSVKLLSVSGTRAGVNAFGIFLSFPLSASLSP